MFTKFIDLIRDIFASPKKRLEMKTRQLAVQTTNDFDILQKIIKDSEYAVADHQKVFNDRDQFLRDNADTQVDQNVSRNTDNKRAKYILWVVVSVACVLSVKGLRFFLGEFYSSVNMWIILPMAFFLAYFIVHGSIYINNFSDRYKSQNSYIYYQLKVFAYSMVLFIPAMNLLEGFDSNYRPVVMALNIVGCIIDVVLHTSLVSMSKVFTTAEDSKEAIEIMKLKDQALATADQKLRTLNETFIKAKITFTSSAKQFISSFKELHAINPQAAANVLFLLDNFTIWMLNNKVMQHALIPYHADENGHPVVELRYFTPEQDTFRLGWDTLSKVNVVITDNQPEQALNLESQTSELTTTDETMQQTQNPAEDTYQPPQEAEQADNHPADFDTILDNVNENDKTL